MTPSDLPIAPPSPDRELAELEQVLAQRRRELAAEPHGAPALEPLGDYIKRVGAAAEASAAKSTTWAKLAVVADEPPPPIVGLPKRFRGAPEDLCTRVHSRRAVERALAIDPREPFVILCGPSGSGKTSLAVAAIRTVLAPKPAPLFAMARTLGLAPSRWPLGQGRSPEEEDATRARVLLIDDLGRDPNVLSNPIAEIIDRRWNEERITWVTTFLTPDQVAERYDAGMARRLFEGAVIVDCGEL